MTPQVRHDSSHRQTHVQDKHLEQMEEEARKNSVTNSLDNQLLAQAKVFADTVTLSDAVTLADTVTILQKPQSPKVSFKSTNFNIKHPFKVSHPQSPPRSPPRSPSPTLYAKLRSQSPVQGVRPKNIVTSPILRSVSPTLRSTSPTVALNPSPFGLFPIGRHFS
jgi:hypothetical protein